MKIKKMNWFVKLITGGWAGSITLCPFGIYVNEKMWKYQEYAIPTWNVLINKEKIHWAQQLEMLVVFFYIWYFIEWILRILLPPYPGAYNDICFERESKTNGDNLDYLKTRKHYAWVKNIFHK